MSQKWNYNGNEFEVDLQDADFAERYEQAFERLGKAEKELQKDGRNSEIIRGYCQMFFQLFDDLYGEGTSRKLFGDKVNAGMCDEAYSVFINAARRCNAEAIQRRNEILNKYAPGQDRKERRWKNKYSGGQR